MGIANERKTLLIKRANLIFKNFSGKETKYTREGKKTFNVVIEDPDTAMALAEEGWNISLLKPRNEEDEPRWKLPVEARYDNFPPRVVMRRKGRPDVELDEESVGCLDYAHITNAYVNINASRWVNRDGDTCIKAYLKSMIVDIDEDELMAMLEAGELDDTEENPW